MKGKILTMTYYNFVNNDRIFRVMHHVMNCYIKSTFLGEFERLKTEVFRKNKIRAINIFLIPILLYTFDVIQWSDTHLQFVNRRVRVVLASNNIQNRKEGRSMPKRKCT